jgi:chemotaxis protein CheC
MGMSFNELNNLQLDVLREIGNIGSGNAITALAKMINRKVDMLVPKVKILEFNSVNEILGEPELIVVGILLNVSGDLSGSILFTLSQKSAQILVNMLFDRQIDVESVEMFDEIERSALKEIGNILTGAYLSAISSLTNLNISYSIPDIAVDMAGAILSVPAIEFAKLGDTVLYIETEFSEGKESVLGDFFLIPDMDSYDILLKALGVEI